MDIFKKILNFGNKKGLEDYMQFEGGGMSEDSQVDRRNLLSNNKNWVYVCTDKIASSVASVELVLHKYNSKGDDEEIFDHPILDFIYKPSLQLSQRDWVYSHITNNLISGNAYWKIEKTGKEIELIYLNPSKVEPRIDKDGKVVGYKYTKASGKTEVLEFEDVLHDKRPNPNNPYVGLSILEPIAEWIDIDAYASEFNRRFFINGAKFGGFIELEGDTDTSVKLVQAGLEKYVGVKNAHKIGVLPKGAKYAREGQSMSDMQFVEADARFRDKILSAFGIPKAVLGIVDDVNRANAEASEYVYAKYSLKPTVVSFINFLNENVIPLFDDSEQYYFDYREFVPEDKEYKLKQAEVALNKNPYMTINEVRASHGLPPISNGDVVVGNPMLAPIGKPEEKKTINKPKSKVEKRAELVDKAVDSVFDKIGQSKSDEQPFTKAQEAILDAKHKEFVGRVSDYEKQLREKTAEFNLKQANEVKRNLSNIVGKAVNKGDIFNIDEEMGAMIDFATPILKLLAKEEGELAFLDLGVDSTFDPNSERITKAVNKSVNDMADSYNNTTLDLLKKELNDGITEGEGLAELTKRVDTVYEFRTSNGAVALARTEAFNVANMASKEAYIQSGVVQSIKWFTSEDERVCQFCGPMHGKEIGVKETFFKKGDKMQGAEGGEMKLDYRTISNPPLHTNCRCFINPEKIEI